MWDGLASRAAPYKVQIANPCYDGLRTRDTRRPFAGPARFLTMSGAIPTASPSPTTGWFPWRAARSGSAGRTPGWQPPEDDDHGGQRVRPPLPHPRAAGWVSPHPVLRLSRLLPSCAKACVLPGTPRHGTACSNGRSARGLPRPVRGTDRAVVTPMFALPTGNVVVIGCIARPPVCGSGRET
jgi:hypothetical protein